MIGDNDPTLRKAWLIAVDYCPGLLRLRSCRRDALDNFFWENLAILSLEADEKGYPPDKLADWIILEARRYRLISWLECVRGRWSISVLSFFSWMDHG
jgi:hypothetical protein